MKIIGIGEVVWDCLPDGKKLGGAPVNFCFFAKELGAEAYPITAVGTDALADETMASLVSTGLCLDYVEHTPLPTSRVLVEVDDEGIPQYNILENVAWDHMHATKEALQLMADADAVCWGSLAQRSDVSAQAINALLDATPGNALRVFDINIRQHYYSLPVVVDSLHRANVLKLNEDELPLLINLLSLPENQSEAIAALIELFELRYIVFTQGSVCSGIFNSSGEISHLPTPRVSVADTVGAGDSFTATFVTGLLSGFSVADAHRRAVDVAAFVCTQHGAINPLPQALRG